MLWLVLGPKRPGPKRRALLALPQGSGILVSNPTSMSVCTPGACCKQGGLPAQHPGAMSRRGAAFSFAVCSSQSFLVIHASLP